MNQIKIIDGVLVLPSPFISYQPRQIQAGSVDFRRGVSIDEDPSTLFNSTYTVTLQRMENILPSDYRLAIGFKSININFQNYPSFQYYTIYYSNQQAQLFDIICRVGYQNLFVRIEASYLVISLQVGLIYSFYKTCALNAAIVSPGTLSCSYSDPSIQTSAKGYYIMHSVYNLGGIGYTASTSGHSHHQLKCQIIAINTTDYNIVYSGDGFYLGSISVQGFLLQKGNVFGNTTKRIIMKSWNLTVQGSINTPLNGPCLTFPIPGVSNPNIFLGLFSFWSMSNQFQFIFRIDTTDNKLWVQEGASTYIMTNVLFLFYSYKCINSYYYEEDSLSCELCQSYCAVCETKHVCITCVNTFTLTITDSTTLPKKVGCLCDKTIAAGVCYDPMNSPTLKGCLLPIIDNVTGLIFCRYCSHLQYLNSTNGQCHCVVGFQKQNLTNQCQQICGDGLIINHQCDDGNLINDDGCDSQCKIQKGFLCQTNVIPTLCESEIALVLTVLKIYKNSNNSADVTFGFKNAALMPYKLDIEQFIIQNILQKRSMFNLYYVIQNSGSFSMIDTHARLIEVKDNQLKFLIDYTFTIEKLKGRLQLDMANTQYLKQNLTLDFSIAGDNQQLKYNSLIAIYQGAEIGYIIMGIAFFILLMAGLLAPKYIGLQSILTLQLIYYSCLMINDGQNIPFGLETFSFFKYSIGFNSLFTITEILQNPSSRSRYVSLNLQKTVIQNYNISFVLFFLISFIFFVTALFRFKKQKYFYLIQHLKLTEQYENSKQKFRFALFLNQNCYNIYNQIGMFSILQIIASISLEILINNQGVVINQDSILLKIRGVIFIIASIFVIFNGLNHFKNLYMSEISWIKLQQRPKQLYYKQANFVYLLFIGSVILFFHDAILFEVIPCSMIVLIIHIIYMGILTKINPYKVSLRIHTYGLALNQIIYLIFLLFLNLVNLNINLSQIFSLIIIYLVLLLCAVLLIFTIIRLYYEYRFGQELQKKVQREREEEKRLKEELEKKRIKIKAKTFQEQAKEKLDLQEIANLQNNFLYENQIREDQMIEEINWLKKRKMLTEEQKQAYYFQKYHQKPLQWLQQNDQAIYQKRMIQQNQRKAKQISRQQQKLSDDSYKKILKDLKKDFMSRQKQISFLYNISKPQYQML